MGDDPRWTRSRTAIRAAAATLLEGHGPSAVTHARIADEAGVSRATVYRHWPDTAPLLLEVMATGELPFLLDPVSPVRSWLRARLTELADELAQPAVQATVSTLVHGRLWNPEMAARCNGFVTTLQDRLAAAFVVAVSAGELDVAPDPVDATARLIGPLVFRTAFQAGTVDGDLIEELLDAVVPESSAERE